VKGPERRGRVRCLGKLPRHASSNISSQRTNSEDRLQKVESVLGNLVAVLQMRFSDDPQINAVLRTGCSSRGKKSYFSTSRMFFKKIKYTFFHLGT
jgi:hypothetical protein